MNETLLIQAAQVLGAALIGAIGTWFSIKAKNREDKTNAADKLIDQLQEEVERVTQLKEQMEKKLDELASENRAYKRFSLAIELWSMRGAEPPPPKLNDFLEQP